MIAILAVPVAAVLIAWAWVAARRMNYLRGKADAFQQVADEFTGLTRASWIRHDAQKQQAERKKHWMRLCLCDPQVCDALADALVDAREYWRRSVH